MEYVELEKVYNNLKKKLVLKIEEKEWLEKHEFYELKTDYILKIGVLEHKLFELDYKLIRTKRKIEIIQITFNENIPINIPFIDSQLDMEFVQYIELLRIKASEIKIAKYLVNFDKLSSEDTLKLRKFFRKLTNTTHPNFYIENTETQEKLWQKGVIAYENADLEFLEIITKLAKDEAQVTSKRLSTEEIQLKSDFFEKRIEEVSEEIKVIKEDFPFTKRHLLEDEKLLKIEQKDLLLRIKESENILKILEDHFLLMLDETTFIM